MDGLYLIIRSFADLTMDRALAVARAFDAHPPLRPVKVGGDPARIRVEPSLEALVAKHGLPIQWLTVRRNGRYPDFEGGEIDLMRGRGSWSGTPPEWAEESEIGGPNHLGKFVYHLAGHKIEQYWLAGTLSEPGFVDLVAALFEGLVVAVDAAYGYVVAESRRPDGLPSAVDRQLPGVFWLNYFGPAFVNAHRALEAVAGARRLATGGILVQTTEEPWQPIVQGIPEWQLELRDLFGDEAFAFVKPHNPGLPSIDEHVAASPGTMEMPWVAHLATKAADDKVRKYAAAKKRMQAALVGRSSPVLNGDVIEWSTSFDLDDFPSFFAYLKRRLGGDLSSPLGNALRAVIANAPLDEEEGLLLDTKFGTVRLVWFIDDVETIDLYVFGPAAVRTVCDAWFE